MLVPLTTEEVTADWFENILNIKIDRESFSAAGNANAGVGFLSNLVRVRFEDTSNKEHCVVVKLLPPLDVDRELVTAERLDQSELHFYQKLIPELLNEIPSLKSYFCPMVYGEVQQEDSKNNIPYASVLVLKDLKPEGYIMKPFSTAELTVEEIQLTIDFFANFHAAGTLLELRKQTSLSKVYSYILPEWYYPNEKRVRQFVTHTWFIDGFGHAKKSISDYVTNVDPSKEKMGKEIITKLIEPLAPYAQEIFNEIMRAGKSFPSLVHGDLWQNNLLISPHNPTSVKIIDWQMAGYTDSVYDVGLFFVTSLSPNLNLEKLEQHGRIYFDYLESIYSEQQKKGVDLSKMKRRSWQEFRQALKTYGVAFAFIVYIMGCNTISEFPEHLPKIFDGFRFFHYDTDLAEFLLNALK